MTRRPLLVAAVLLGGVSVAAAQEAREFSLERLRITPDRTGVIDVEWGDTIPHLEWDFALWGTLEDDPLVVRRDGDRVGTLVHRRAGAAIVGAIGLGKRFQLGIELPLVLYQTRSEAQPDIAPADLESIGGVGLGDIRLLPKLKLVRGLALVLGIDLPSGRDDYRGGTALGLYPEVAVSGRVGKRLRLAANLGYRMRGDQEFLDQKIEDELTGRVGVGVDLSAKVAIETSLNIATAAGGPFDHANQTPLEWLGQVVLPLGRLVVFAGGGAGLNEGYGAPDWRVLAGVRLGTVGMPPEYVPPPEPTSMPAPEPEPEIEIAPPPPDSDGDGLKDPDDKCPQDPEDKDEFEDDDGCPDVDNDKDGVTDARDRCPNEPGVEANQGCPDTDRDGDTVVDRLDNCPDEPGTPKNQGCKDKQLVTIGDGKLEILDAVYFKTNSDIIEKRSFKLLDNVAKVIVAHAEVGVIRVEGHTDDRGDDAMNLDLSQRRAESVQNYLVGKGVPAERLAAKGYGETQPVKPNTNKTNRAANRRVVFVIVSSELKSMESGPSNETIDR